MAKKIGILSLALSVLNLICMFVSPIRFGEITGYFNFFNFRSLEFLSFNFGDYSSFFFVNTNLINVVLTFMFLIGALVYTNSNYKNFTLLRFIYSVILFTLVIFLPLRFIHSYSYFFGLENDFYHEMPQRGPTFVEVVLSLISYTYTIVLIVICYKITRFFNAQQQVKFEEIDYGYSKSTTFIEAKTIKRFVNLLVDNIVFMTVFYTFFSSIVYYDFVPQFLSKFENAFGERFSLFILVSVCRIIYYLFFECQFSATPAKFLTQTRVMSYDGTKANLKLIIVRTLSRLFPLESITFLFGYNLHDNWSQTAVFEEESIKESLTTE